MWMTDYIRSVKHGLRDVYGFIPDGGTTEDPTFSSVPDGSYPMSIDGMIDWVEIKGGRILCCKFRKHVNARTFNDLILALRQMFEVKDVVAWLETPNPAFEGRQPMELIEAGEIDRIWNMIYEIEAKTAF